MAQVVKRRQHWRDEIKDAQTPEKKTRVIQNWMHYRVPSPSDIDDLGEFEETDTTPGAASSTPNHWQGNFDFQYQVLKAPLQAFVGDSTDPINTALIGLRKAENPRHWLNMKALGVNSSVPMEVFPAQRAVRWQDIWTNCDLAFRLGRHRMDKQIKLKAPGHPNSFRFALRLPNGYTHSLVGTKLTIFDASSDIIFRSGKLWAMDDDDNSVGVDLIAAPDITVGQKTFPTFRIVPNPTDLATASYPVIVDPSVTIDQIADIEDCFLFEDSAGGPSHSNYGASTSFGTLIGVNTARYFYRGLERIADSALPEGTVTSFKHHVYLAGSAGINGTPTGIVYRVAAANAGWVEGTSNGSPQVGSVDWQHPTHNVGSWAGSAGINTATTDYDTVGATVTLGNVVGWKEHDLITTWVEAWKSGAWTNAGMITRSEYDFYPAVPSPATAYSYYHSMDMANQPYYVIEYEEPASGDSIYGAHLDLASAYKDASLDPKQWIKVG